MLAALPRAEVAWDFLVFRGEMPSDGNGREYRPPCPAQKPRGDFVVAEEMPGDGDGQRCWPPCPAQKWRDFLALLGEIPSDGNGREYGLPRPAQKPCGDFVLAEETTCAGDSRRCLSMRPAQKWRGTSWHCCGRCEAMAVAESIGHRSPRRSRTGNSSSPRR